MLDQGQDKSVSDLREEIIRLGPWHIQVQVTPEVDTSAFLEAPPGTYEGAKDARKVQFLDPRKPFENLMRRIYPAGLEGRTFLDCACNCGAYSFWAKEIGASRCFGFDVRDHWVDQARFLQQNRTVGPTDGVRFETMDLYELPKAGLEPFDVTLFKGIFYHLPDPITGLKAAADLTKELLVLDTATRNGLPDGVLAVDTENREQVMSGVYGLNWFPTGPGVLDHVLRWMGFEETWTVFWRGRTAGQPPHLGRLRLVASRRKGLLEGFESVTEPS